MADTTKLSVEKALNKIRKADAQKGKSAQHENQMDAQHLFANLNEARNIIEEWRIDYNTNRPHTSLNGLTPTEFATGPNRGQNQNRRSL